MGARQLGQRYARQSGQFPSSTTGAGRPGGLIGYPRNPLAPGHGFGSRRGRAFLATRVFLSLAFLVDSACSCVTGKGREGRTLLVKISGNGTAGEEGRETSSPV